MCSYVDLTNVPKDGFTADKDITCYKVLVRRNNCLESPFVNFCYEIGKAVPKCQVVLSDKKVLDTVLYCPITKSLNKFLLVENFYLFSYKNYIKFIGVKDSGLSETITGYYSFTGYMNEEMERLVKHTWHQCNYPIVVRCIIPKGSRYYVADNSETFISDQLKVECIVKEFDI